MIGSKERSKFPVIALGVVCAATISASVMLARAQSSPPNAQPAAPAQTQVPNLPKVYLPGLGEFMLTIQIHHAKLWHAAKAGNWPLAAYQLSEMKEVFAEVQDQVPKYKDIPVGDMIDAVVTGPIAALEKAVEDKKFKEFSAAFDKLTAACNDCHKAGSRPFITVRRPTRSTFDNEEFRPSRKK
jgi:hypothetical protein